ncbi:MAG: acyl-CoA dehydrogenase family protein [candidate division Zixibacteria bacterium]|nr:acyl-CoA dehydrogenase family protein [candidate division Zixibacteria bacterium]
MLLKKEHQEFREKIRAFALEHVAPQAAALDVEQRFPKEYLPLLAKEGLLGMVVSEEFGGSKIDTVSYSIAVEELSRVCGSTGITVAAHNSLGCFPIYKFGTDEQRKKYLPRGTSGGELLAFGLTEPDAGSDAGATKTTAVKKDTHWEMNGTKCFITSATHAFASIATARTSDAQGVKAISSFILEKEWDGYEVGKKENKMGLRGSDTAFFHFTDLKVPFENLMGELNDGFRQFMVTLDGGRISIGAMALGLGQGALDCAVKYAAESSVNGKPKSASQAIQFKLADMATEMEAARYMVYGASQMKDAGVKFSKESAMAKLYASEVGRRVAYDAIQVLGDVGFFSNQFPAERIFRDVKLCEIGEGTSEIQRIVIAREVLKSVMPV